MLKSVANLCNRRTTAKYIVSIKKRMSAEVIYWEFKKWFTIQIQYIQDVFFLNGLYFYFETSGFFYRISELEAKYYELDLGFEYPSSSQNTRGRTQITQIIEPEYPSLYPNLAFEFRFYRHSVIFQFLIAKTRRNPQILCS